MNHKAQYAPESSAATSRENLYPDFTLTEDNCSQEPIHRPISIQAHGHVLVVDMSGEPRLHAVSDGLAPCLGFTTEAVWSQPGFDWLPDAIQSIIAGADSTHRLPNSLGETLTLGNQVFEVQHHQHDKNLVIEFQPQSNTDVQDGFIREAAQVFRQTNELESLYAQASRIVAEAFGYDRVMIYEFDHNQHGCVVGEHKRDDLEPFLGLHYPESDIPQIARQLFLLIKSRAIPDVNGRCIALRFNPTLGPKPPNLDLTFSQLRATSPIHIEYLQNMGVGATLTFAIVINGKLWGLIACHHYLSRHIHLNHQLIGEAVAELLAKRILELVVAKQAATEAAARAVESRLLEQVKIGENYRVEILEHADAIIDLCAADGAALMTLDQCVFSTGLVPDSEALLAIRDWLVSEGHTEVFCTANFRQDVPVRIETAQAIGGMLVSCLSNLSNSYILWFRQKESQTVKWAGDPANSYSVEPASNGGEVRISPRRSFAKWLVSIEDQSRRWEDSTLAMADRVRQGMFKVELRRSAEILERSNKEFMQLTFAAAHDLQEPLRTQSNYLELMNECLETGDHDQMRKCIARVDNAATRMSDLVSDLLNYSRIGAESKREQVDLGLLVSQIIEGLEATIGESNAVLKVADLPTVRGDTAKLRQLMQNLLTNAIKYVEPGVSPEVTVSMERTGAYYSLNVKDNGIGIDPKFHSKVFLLYQRLHGRDEYRGTGIGLAICAKVAESMGAEIGVNSAPGAGSTFWLRLHHSQII
ncbi:MAG: ATP-binding protein [Burkholderiaceae bacterium]